MARSSPERFASVLCCETVSLSLSLEDQLLSARPLAFLCQRRDLRVHVARANPANSKLDDKGQVGLSTGRRKTFKWCYLTTRQQNNRRAMFLRVSAYCSLSPSSSIERRVVISCNFVCPRQQEKLGMLVVVRRVAERSSIPCPPV